jgi:hypothetical protein
MPTMSSLMSERDLGEQESSKFAGVTYQLKEHIGEIEPSRWHMFDRLPFDQLFVLELLVILSPALLFPICSFGALAAWTKF